MPKGLRPYQIAKGVRIGIWIGWPPNTPGLPKFHLRKDVANDVAVHIC
jgi:hypothetical protein